MECEMMDCPRCGYDYPNGCDVTCDYKHPMMEWIPTKDRLPPNELDEVLVYNGNIRVGYLHQGILKISCSLCDEDEPTHWMPLPEEPEE